ncbi:MAG: dehydrogenase [Xanthomonadaceae bacterium]|nr:dehydrogenase [Xanthomonadaceae bacterium]MDE3071378.1 dehydrogenase [Pseudomonadota bacterium]
MAYLLLIVEPRGQREARSDEERRRAYAQMVAFGGDLKERGLLLASHSLLSDVHGVRVQKRDGRSSLKDGPFAEAKEMIGGFFLLECAGRDQALSIAAECPAAEWATVEVRETGPCFED